MTYQAEIMNVEDAWRAFGYRMTAMPIPGQEAEFVEGMWSELSKTEQRYQFMRSLLKGYRGQRRSKLAKQYLVADYPVPCFGVRAA